MGKIFLKRLKDSVFSVLPISLIVIVLSLIFIPDVKYSIITFVICSIFLMVGMCLFNIGSEMSLMKMGDYVGAHLSKSKKVVLLLLCALLIGTIITIAEPDLSILAGQVSGFNKWIFIIGVALGAGVFLLLAVLRLLLKIKMKYLLLGCYLIIFILMFFVPKQILPISFDTSGVSTGSLSVPFIMAFGLGICALRKNESEQENGFGLLAICSIGPIFAIMLMGLFIGGGAGVATEVQSYEVISSFAEMFKVIGLSLLDNIKDVALILLPIIVFFLIYQFAFLKFPLKNLIRLGIGIVYTFVGITLFFTGVSAGYLNIAHLLSYNIMSSSIKWIIIPISFLIGLFIAMAEPAVHVLNKQVEDLSSGVISKKSMLVSLSIGVSFSVVLTTLRVLLEFNIIYVLAPMLIIAVGLAFFVPSNISSIAFDSGGVVAGTLSTSFILPFTKGICWAKGVDEMVFGFGSIGIINLVPVIVVELMGVRMILKNKKFELFKQKSAKRVSIIEFD